jgi:hypothetical protein
MTRPMPVDPSQVAPDLIGVGAQAIQDRARALGLTWTMRPATVVTYDSNTGKATAIYDGDTVALGMDCLVGGLVNGQRVMGMAVPPGANYILGTFGTSVATTPQMVGYTSAFGNTAATTAELLVQTLVTSPLSTGRCYEVRVSGHYTMSVANSTGIVRMRKTNIGGTVFAEWGTGPVSVFGANTSTTNSNKFQVTSAGIITMVKTLASGGAASIIDSSGTNTPRAIEVWDVGPVSLYTNVSSI